jgi:hypothetical protein
MKSQIWLLMNAISMKTITFDQLLYYQVMLFIWADLFNESKNEIRADKTYEHYCGISDIV